MEVTAVIFAEKFPVKQGNMEKPDIRGIHNTCTFSV